jgi:hypothetical protein
MTLSRNLYEIFYADSLAHAVGYVNGNGKVAYRPIEKLPELKEIENHLAGDVVLGAYPLHPGTNTVSWAAFDVDSKIGGLAEARKLAEKISNFLISKGIPHGVEFSGSKGYHIIIFFTQKENAADVKLCMDQIRDQLALPKTGDPHVEVYPKQSELTPSNPYGNLLRLPLGAHPKTGVITFFVNTTDWEDGSPLDAEEIFSQKISLADLQRATKQETDNLEKIINTISPYWSTGQRHDISLYLGGYLATMDWTEEATIDVLAKIHALVPEGDLDDQIKTVKSTYKKHYAGEAIAGMSGLSKVMPASVLNDLHAFVGKQASSSIMLTVDRLRLGKLAPFLKVRSSASAIVAYLLEHGKLAKDATDTYWLNQETHNLIAFETPDWTRFAHNFFGINTTEAFGRQVMESVRHMAYDKARDVKVSRRAYYDIENHLLYLNLGGPEIYILNGESDKREVVYNGEIDVMFKNADDSFHLPDLRKNPDPAISPWLFLTDDLNFAEGAEGTTAEQQREMVKAYFMGTFFAELMPTRAILTFLGSSGFGKTTAARRLLQIIEGPDSDVTPVNADKQDSLRASVIAHRYMVLDNLEEAGNARWLPDMLNVLSTGGHFELRQLHTTNSMKKYIPNISMSLTATVMPFAKETVYTRMLPLQMGPVLSRRDEGIIKSELRKNFPAIWKGVMDDLDKTIIQLKTVTSVAVPGESRLADFTVFCSRIKNADYLQGDVLMAGLGNLVNRQRQALEENSPFIGILAAFMLTVPGGDTGWMDTAEVYTRTQKIAKLGGMEFRWSTVQALSKHLEMLEPQLIQNFGMSMRKIKNNGRDVKQYKFIRKMTKDE